MEERLFIIACAMYVFSFISKELFKKGKLENQTIFGIWNGLFWLFFLGSLYFLFQFIVFSGSENNLQQSFAQKNVLIWVGIVVFAFLNFIYGKLRISRREPIKKFAFEWANTLYFAGFVASFVMFFFIQAFKIPSASMYNTLQIGDHLFVNKAAYGFRLPLTDIHFGQFRQVKKGDIIVFSFPAATRDQVNCGGFQYGRDYVKRVVGLPGDTVEVKQGDLYINGDKEPLHGYEVFRVTERFGPVVRITNEPSTEKGFFYVAPMVYQTLWESGKLEYEFGISLRDNFGPVTVPEGKYFAMGDNRDDSCDSRFWGPVPFENIKGTAWFIHWPLNRIRLIK